jgi:ABC-2 type transport system permease protein
MVADASPSLSWLTWTSPLGWVERLQPFTDPRPIALVPIVALSAALLGATVLLAGRRDLGAGVLADRNRRVARTALLRGPTGLTIRLIRPVVLGWLAGIAAFSMLLGSVAHQAVQSIDASHSAKVALNRLIGTTGPLQAYLGVSFLLVAVLVALLAAGQVTMLRREEAAGRLDHLLVRPISRTRWLASRLAVSAGAVVLAGMVGGVAAWAGAATQRGGPGFPSLLDAGVNTVPAALCVLGLGILSWAVFPRHSTVAAYGVLAWSFLAELLAGTVHANRWLLDTSIFHHLAPSPAVAPDWTSGGVLCGIGIVAVVLGALWFNRRDLADE